MKKIALLLVLYSWLPLQKIYAQELEWVEDKTNGGGTLWRTIFLHCLILSQNIAGDTRRFYKRK